MTIRSMLLAVVFAFAVNAQPVHAKSKSDAYCLALTAFTEARDQGEHGMALVVHTVLNRTQSRNKTPCQVAYQAHQYNGVLDWPAHVAPSTRNPKVWHTAMQVTLKVMRGDWDFGDCAGSEYFFAPAVVRRLPAWSRKLPYKCTYRGHKFYGA